MYEFLNPAKELQIGSTEYYRFRKWLAEVDHFPTRMRLTSIKPEYLVQWLNEYKQMERGFYQS